jgi:membrane fusion protein (multidrug efflux system)
LWFTRFRPFYRRVKLNRRNPMPEKSSGPSRDGPSDSAGPTPTKQPGKRTTRRIQWLFLFVALATVLALAWRSPVGREFGVRCLGKLGPGGVPLLRHELWDESFDVQAAARAELTRLGEKAVPSLVKSLNATDARKQIEALHALAVLGSPGRAAAPVVIGLLGDKNPMMRIQALTTLGAIGESNPAVATAVIHVMEDPDASIRLSATKTLGDVRPSANLALPALVKALKTDLELNVRFEAAVVFGRLNLRTPEALSALQEIAEQDASPKVREEANEVLALLNPQRKATANKETARGEFVSSSPSSSTEVAVHVGAVSLTTLRQYVTAFGTVEPEPGIPGKAPASAKITSPLAGLVAEVKCAEGQPVEKGQVLFTLDRRSLDARIEQARAALAQTSQLSITAPLAGTVTLVNVRPGEVTDPESPAADLPAVKAGQAVEVLASKDAAGMANILTGSVTFMEDRVDNKTDMGTVDISIPAPAHLRCGQFVRVKIVTDERRDCPAVPSQSLVQNEDGEWVIGLVRGKLAVQIPVVPGLRDGGLVEVQSPAIKAGDRIVTTGAAALSPKSVIRILQD